MTGKSSKVEDYWREHNIESLFKELTQILVRRTPIDPAIAIFEYLQKKYPKSFKAITQTDVKNESFISSRRTSNQSQISGIVTIPSMNSAFTDLLNTNTNLVQSKPEALFKNLVFANRFGQQVIKLAKNICTDCDILEEETIKPIETKSTNESHTHAPIENLNNLETHDEPTIPQIIKYKQQIRLENVRRIHRQELADLAKEKREREGYIRSDLIDTSEEIQQQLNGNHDDDDDDSLKAEHIKSTRKMSHKPIVNSKEEEDILNDENIFRPKKQRERTRPKAPRFNRNHRLTVDFQSTMRSIHDNQTCQFCGHILNKKDQQLSTIRSVQTQPLIQSVESTNTEIVDDWFEPGSDAQTPSPTTGGGSSTFRRNLFQPIDDHVEHRPPIIEPVNKRSITPRLSETGVFARSPATKKLQTSNSNDHEN